MSIMGGGGRSGHSAGGGDDDGSGGASAGGDDDCNNILYIYIYTKNHIVNPNPFLVLGQSSFEFVVTCIPYLQRLMVVLRGGGVLGGYGSWSATLAVLSAEAVANNLCVVDAI